MSSVIITSAPAKYIGRDRLPQKIPPSHRETRTQRALVEETPRDYLLETTVSPKNGNGSNGHNGSNGNGHNGSNGHGLTPITTRDLFPLASVALKESQPSNPFEDIITQYFSTPKNTRILLCGIDQIWRQSKLFSDELDNDTHRQYLELLTTIVEESKDSFIQSLRDDLPTNFPREFKLFCKKSDMKYQQKSICATQALELALLGVDPTRILLRINSSRGHYSSGYSTELQAGWFLAKFIYQYKANDGKELILSKDFPEKEVDIVTPQALGEIKSSSNHLTGQLGLLFKLITGHETLRDNVKKIIVVKNALRAYQFAPAFRETDDYRETKTKFISDLKERFVELKILTKETRGKNEIFTPVDPDDTEYFRRLISSSGIDIYLTPEVDDSENVSRWIKQNYEAFDEQKRIKKAA